MLVTIKKDGTIEYLYKEELRPLMKEGESRIARASHVEPDPEKPTTWMVDLTPRGGPVLKGFESRDEALREEVKWLEALGLGEAISAAPKCPQCGGRGGWEDDDDGQFVTCNICNRQPIHSADGR
jgi:hypothetical protein